MDGEHAKEFDKLAPENHFQLEEQISKRQLTRGQKIWRSVRNNGLTIGTVIAVVLGIGVGLLLRSVKDSWSSREIMYVSFLGDLFLRMLKCLILPLIASSLISAIASLDLSLSSRIAARTVAFYMTTTFFAVVLGIIMVSAIRPGHGHTAGSKASSGPLLTRNVTTTDTLLDLVRNMFPPNIVQACVQTGHTNLIPNDNESDIYRLEIGEEAFEGGTNIIGMVVFSAAVGIALAQLGEEGRPVADFFRAMVRVVMKLTHWVIMLSPGGVFFLVASRIAKMQDMGEVMGQLGMYFMTVLVGLLVQGFVVLPLIYFALTRKSPLRYILNLKPALVCAFGTASSAATLPLTMECLEQRSGIDPRITRFALPIGATINLDGTALYEAVAAIFIAQVHGVPLPVPKLIAVSITATAASMGAAGIPQAGLVTMVMVLNTVGLPATEIALIYAVDWLLDRFRTTVNVLGDAFGAGIVYYRSRKDLESVMT